MEFTHLQVRSTYSLLNSTISISDLIKFAKAKQLTTLSLVEEGTMHGAIKFYQACQKANIKPIIGISLKVKIHTLTDEWIFLAKNKSGYQSLLKLASLNALNEGVVDIETIITHTSQLIICTSGENTTIDINTIKDYLPKLPHFYIGLSRINAPTLERSQHLISLAQQLELPVVALNEVCYLEKEDAKTFHFLQAIKENELLSETLNLETGRSYLSAANMRELFHDCPEALASVAEIVSLCQVEIDLQQRLLPKYGGDVPANDYLEALCQRGLSKRYGQNKTSAHDERLSYELSIIKEMGFADYFLIVWDFIKYAKTNNILVGPGRGSAAGSLVAYVLGITNVDPIKYELLFERFLNPERITLPDIDIDFQDNRRHEVIKYVQAKYGANSVVQILTFGTFKSRSAWRDLARIHQVETKLINQVAKFIYSGSTLAAIYEQNTGLREFFEAYPRLEMIYKEAMRIEKMPRHTSIHAAGIIISDHDLTNYTAITKDHSDLYISQYEADDLEAIGLLKMDFLGLRNLTMLQEISNLVRHHLDPNFNLNTLNFDDPNVYDLMCRGATTGIFQLESEGMRQALKIVRPTNLEDVIACVALFRPGPMENIPLFAARKHGKEQVTYYHDSLRPILEKTYGIIVYQEQIMQIAHHISGYSLGEADVLRRAVSKKDKRVLEQEEQKFIRKAVEQGYQEKVARELYSLILKFANYGFNRSHAASYSMIAYQMAYLKVNFPCYFIAVALSNFIGSERHSAEYIKEAKQLGITILPPSVNKSQMRYEVEGNSIRFSLLPIKNIGHQLAKQLIEEREKGVYQSFYDFVTRTRSFMGERTYESLIDVGALDEFGYNRATLHANLAAILSFAKYDGGLFGTEFEMREVAAELPHSEIMKREKNLLGFYLTSHPVALISALVREKGWYLPSDVSNLSAKVITCVGFVEHVRQIRDKKGELMGFMTLSDENISLPITIFSRVYKSEYRSLLGQVIAVSGTLTMRNNEKNLTLNKIITLF